MEAQRTVHLAQRSKIVRILALISEIPIRMQIHCFEPPIGKAEVDNPLGWHATELRNRQAVPNAHVRDLAARKANPRLPGVLISVACIPCRKRHHRRSHVSIKAKGGDFGVVGMRSNDQHAIVRRQLLAADMQARLSRLPCDPMTD